MRLLYESIKEPAKACLLALQFAGIKVKQVEQPVPIITLQLGDYDKSGNSVELMGELSISRFAMNQCSWSPKDLLGLDEWLLYHMKPMTAATPKSQIKSSQDLLNAMSHLEQQITGDYIGGDKPCSSDILAFTYLYQYFSASPWLHKTYPKLGNLYNNIDSVYAQIQESIGEKVKAPSKKYKGAEEFASHATIQRDKTNKILPEPGKRNILITSALPYVNNVPHLGNIIGCVLSADVYSRYCRLRGYNSIFICGTDEYGTATETKAIQEKTTPKEICDKYYKVHKEIYEWFDIDFDYFGRTTTQQQTEIAQHIFLKLLQNQELEENSVDQAYCEQCSRFLADRFVLGTCPGCGYENARGDQCDKCAKLLNPDELINSRCFLCSKPPVIRSSNHYFLNLPKIKDRLETWINNTSTSGKWSNNCVKATGAWIRDGLRPRCITRDLKWGTPVPLENYSEKVFYVWFDAPIGYISITANYTDQWEKWWKNPEEVGLVQFMGKDNIPFHTVIFPSSLIGTGENWTLLKTISSTEYLNYEDKKFSKSKNIGVFGDDAINTGIPAEIYRYYLLSNRPESSDTIFKWSDLAEKNNNELLPNLGNLFNRFLKFMSNSKKTVEPTESLDQNDVSALENISLLVQQYFDEMEDIRLKNALKAAMEVSSLGNKYLQDSEFWTLEKKNPERLKTVVYVAMNIVRLTALLIEPFMPSISAKVYAQMSIERDSREETLLKELALNKDPRAILGLVKTGTQVKNVLPIFKTITAEQVNVLRTKFAGSG